MTQLIILLIAFACFTSIVFAQEDDPEDYTGNVYVVNTEDFMSKQELVSKNVEKDIPTLEERWFFRQMAIELENKGDYAGAIRSLQESLRFFRKDDGSAWVSRRHMMRLYEKKGEYESALQEIEWAERHVHNEAAIKLLKEDRQRVEALIRNMSLKL